MRTSVKKNQRKRGKREVATEVAALSAVLARTAIDLVVLVGGISG